MTQYVEKFPIPDPNTSLAQETIRIVKNMLADTINKQNTYKQKARLDELVNEIFN